MIAQFNFVVEVWWQWMSSMIWQAGLLILLVTIVDMAIRRWAWPQVRYVLWGLIFLKLVIPPAWQMPTSVVSWLQPQVENQISIQFEAVDRDAEFSQAMEPVEPIQSQDKMTSGDELPFWQAALFLTWFSGMVAFLLLLSIRMARLRRRHRNRGSRHLPDWFHELLADTVQRMKLGKIPDVVFSENGTGPAVYGLFRPVLILPEGYLEKLSKEQATHVLLHELCHLKRGDLVVHWCCLVLQAVYWFNPLLVWTRRQMRHVCEICCDLSVSNILREKTPGYRNTLLFSARDLFPETAGSSLGLLGIFEEPFRLVSRLKWLEKTTWKNRKRKTAAAVSIGLVMIFCVMPMNGLSQPAVRSEKLSIQANNASADINGRNEQEASDSSQTMIYYEGLVMEVADETGVDIEGLKMNDETTANVSSTAICDEITIEGETYPDLQSATRQLSKMPGVTILQRPILVTLNNQKATIEVGAGPGQSNLLLGITPQLLENGNIRSDILLKVTQISDETTLSTNIEIETVMVFPEGNTLVMRAPLRDEAINQAASPPKSLYLLLAHRIIRNKDQLEAILPEEMRNTSEEGERTPTTRISLRREQVDKAFENVSEAMAQITFTPISENDLNGLQVSDIMPNSIFRRMGLRNDDIFTAVNGRPLVSIDQMYEFFENLKSSNTASLEIYRRGRARLIEYRIS